MQRFIDRYKELSDRIKKYLVIENDDHLYSLHDCMVINEKCGIPVVFNTLHHECFNTSGETTREAFCRAASTWHINRDGVPIVIYGTQDSDEGARRGAYSDHIDKDHFEELICNRLMRAEHQDKSLVVFDIMIEANDKEMSAKECKRIITDYYKKFHIDKAELELSIQELLEEKQEVIYQAQISSRDATTGIKLKTETPTKSKTVKRKLTSEDKTHSKRARINSTQVSKYFDVPSTRYNFLKITSFYG
jgi:hypothetical protein